MVAAVAASTFVVAWFLGRMTAWPERRVAMISAIPIPGVGIALALVMIVSVSTASDEDCGVDACGMMAAAAFTTIVLAVIAFAINYFAGRSACRLARK
ncbi:MAG TPA: hypothetical protein VFU20_07580 [Sphingomicrobium sp.]|nr:hypothetical protein [Sphingomicrobium sp.]